MSTIIFQDFENEHRGAAHFEEGPSGAKPEGRLAEWTVHWRFNFHFWLLAPVGVSWSICVVVFVLEPGSPRTKPLFRL